MDERTPEGELIAIPTGLPGSAVHVIGSGEIDLMEIKRDVLFVPELLAVPKLLRQFQTSRVHLAVVVDEYGATQGIVVRTTENVTNGGWLYLLNQCHARGIGRIDLLVKQDEDNFKSPPSSR